MTHYSRKLRLPFDEVVSKVTQNLMRQGFSILTSIDVQDTFRKDLKVRFRKYKVLGACNPLLAYKAVTLDPHAGTMLPHNVVIQEHENGEVEVSAANPLESIPEEQQTPTMKNLSQEIGIRLRASIDFIQREFTNNRNDAVTEEGNKHYSCFIPG